ncbi:hypothetical protein [Pseudomonas sp. TWR1-1-4]|uniref:hypothetical protein n=1 Tax=Pseudomonas sp. TWR1-1-4 TaxID=2804604 RepID=UPI003CE8F6FF
MPSIVYANEFDICVSMPDLVSWGGDEHSPNADLEAALSSAGIELDIAELYNHYFEDTPIGAGDVHVYSSAVSESLMVIDLYRDLTDQLDLVTVSLKIDKPLTHLVLPLLRRFFDAAECQVLFSQSTHSQRLRSLTDESRYPLPMGENGYRQQIIFHK